MIRPAARARAQLREAERLLAREVLLGGYHLAVDALLGELAERVRFARWELEVAAATRQDLGPLRQKVGEVECYARNVVKLAEAQAHWLPAARAVLAQLRGALSLLEVTP